MSFTVECDIVRECDGVAGRWGVSATYFEIAACSFNDGWKPPCCCMMGLHEPESGGLVPSALSLF